MKVNFEKAPEEVEKPKTTKKPNDVVLSSKLEKVDDISLVIVNDVYIGIATILKGSKLVLTTTGVYGDQLKVNYDDLDDFIDDMQTMVID